MVAQRHITGIIGIVFALAGGFMWYLQQTSLAIVLWGAAVIAIIMLNKRRRKAGGSVSKRNRRD